MEFDKVTLEGKKYQDLVKLAKERDVYRRYAPKAELIERILELNKTPNQNDENNLLSDISMPSLDVSEDDSMDIPLKQGRSKNDKADKSALASTRSALKEMQVSSPAVQKRRKTVAFVTPEQRYSSTKAASSTKGIVRISTPAKPPVVKSTRNSSMATSTPAPTQRQTRASVNVLESTFTVSEDDSPPKLKREGTFEITKSDSETGVFKREGTFEIITVDNNGKKVSQVLTPDGEPASPLETSWSNRTRHSRGSVSTPAAENEAKTPGSASVKELCRIFEPEMETSKKETPAPLSRSYRKSLASPQLKAQSTRSSRLRESLRKSDVKSANISLPSTARKAFVTNRAKPAGYLKPPSTKNLSVCKTPKLKSPSVAKEIQLKQQAVSAKKMLEAKNSTKSKIPPPRKAPNFGDMHGKMFSKMESLVDAKQKVLDRAQEYGTIAFPRCAVTPNLFSAGKTEKFVKEDRPDGSRPAAARHLKLPEKWGQAKDVEDNVFKFGALPEKSSQKSLSEKPKLSPKKLMPANRLISRLPVFTQTRRSGNALNSSNKAPLAKGPVSKPAVSIQAQKETIVTKAPVKRVQDITSKNRNVLRNVRTNKRFELQMQHRMKSQF